MKKVLIISFSFPPLNNIASRRFGDMSKHFKKYGWEPYVLTTNSEGPLEVTIPEENIFRVGVHPQKSSVIIKDNVHSKSVKARAMNLKRKLGFNSRLVDRTYNSWYKKIRNMDLKPLKTKNFDIIIASFGPGSALFAGKYLSEKLGVPWIADFRDLGAPFQDYSFKKNILFKKMDLILEKQMLKSASAITTVSNGLKEELNLFYNHSVHVIYNGWEKQSVSNAKKRDIKGLPYIFYAGRFYEHRMESLYILMESLKTFDFILKIRSLGPSHLNKQIEKVAKEMGISYKLELLPPADPNTIEQEADTAIVNLVIEDLDKTIGWKKGNLTGKFLSLLIKQAPILTIARDDSDIGVILKDTGKGVLCSTISETENYLENLSLYKQTINEDAIFFYSKEKQAGFLSEILNSNSRVD